MNQNNLRCLRIPNKVVSSNPVLQAYFKEIFVGVRLAEKCGVIKEPESLIGGADFSLRIRFILSFDSVKSCKCKYKN